MPMMECTELRIGAAEATLLQLRYRGIPEPDSWTYRPYSVVRLTGTGQQKGYGYPQCTWAWEALDQLSISKFLDFFSCDTDASVEVYISTYTDTGRMRTTTDYSGYMQRPVDGEGKTMFPGSGGNVSQNVTIAFTHLTAA